MLSPVWPGRWNGSCICTPWARMQWAKLTKSRSDCAVVSWPAAGGDDEHAAASNPAATAPASAATLRFTPARLSTAAYLAGTLGTPVAYRAPVLLHSSWNCSALMARPPHHVMCLSVTRSTGRPVTPAVQARALSDLISARLRRDSPGQVVRPRLPGRAACNADVIPVRAG